MPINENDLHRYMCVGQANNKSNRARNSFVMCASVNEYIILIMTFQVEEATFENMQQIIYRNTWNILQRFLPEP